MINNMRDIMWADYILAKNVVLKKKKVKGTNKYIYLPDIINDLNEDREFFQMIDVIHRMGNMVCEGEKVNVIKCLLNWYASARFTKGNKYNMFVSDLTHITPFYPLTDPYILDTLSDKAHTS